MRARGFASNIYDDVYLYRQQRRIKELFINRGGLKDIICTRKCTECFSKRQKYAENRRSISSESSEECRRDVPVLYLYIVAYVCMSSAARGVM